MAGFGLMASSCNIQNSAGTGTDGCDVISLDDLIGAAITTKDVTIDSTTDTFLTKYKEFARKKKLFPLTSIYSFEQNTPQNEMATSSVGIKFEVREGKVELSLTYNKSDCYHASVFAKKGFKKWNIALFFKNYAVGAKSIDGTKFKGFDMGMFSVESFRVQQGTDPQQTKVTFQFTELGTKEWNTRMAKVSYDEIGAELNEIDGAIETTISYVGTLAAGTTVQVDVKSSCNDSPKSGLAGVSWFAGGNTTNTVTAAESATVPGRYTLTFSAALVTGNTIEPRFGTATEYAVEDLLGSMYSGKAPLATI